MRTQVPHSRRSAFTLIELLVVIAIIAILAAILFPVFAQAKLAAKKTVMISNMKQLATASNMYLADADDMFAEAVSGGCTGEATANNKLWSALMFPYVKSKDLFKDASASPSWAGFRYNSSVAVPELGLKANDTPCGTATIRGDLRASTVGLNRQFFSYYICGKDTGQIGCSLDKWEPAEDSASCAPYYTNASRIAEPSSFVLLATTTPDCGSSQLPYVASAVDPMNAKGGYASMNTRLGEGVPLAFADGHAKFYRASADAELAAIAGNPNFRISSIQNRGAVKKRLQMTPVSGNGVLNCVNHNPAKLQWSAFVDLPGQNAALDTLCSAN